MQQNTTAWVFFSEHSMYMYVRLLFRKARTWECRLLLSTVGGVVLC